MYSEKELTEKKAKFALANVALDNADLELKALFEEGVDKLLAEGKFTEAKEYLRPMPQTFSKIEFFRKIIMMEQGK